MGGGGAGFPDPGEARRDAFQVLERVRFGDGFLQFRERDRFGVQPDGLERGGFPRPRVAGGLVEPAEDGGAQVGPFAESGGDLEHAFERPRLAGLRDQGREAFEHRAGLPEVADRAEPGDGFREDDFAAAGAGERALADERVVAVGDEEFGKGFVRLGQVGGGETDREVREDHGLRFALERAEVGQHLGRRDADGRGAHLRVGVLQGGPHVLGAGGAEPVEAPEGMEASRRGAWASASKARRGPAAARSADSTSRRWAESRTQPLGCVRSFTRAEASAGIFVARGAAWSSRTMRQMRPPETGSSSRRALMLAMR